MINSLIDKKKLSFLIDGEPFEASVESVNIEEGNNEVKTVYFLRGGLTLTNIFRYYPDHSACDWVNVWENGGNAPSGVISQLWDCDVDLDMIECEPRTLARAYLPLPQNVIKVYAPRGSEWSGEEFSCRVDELKSNRYSGWLTKVGDKKKYATVGGRSSDSVYAPFFNIKHGKESCGYIAAVGWTGQWNAEIERKESSVHFKSGIEDLNFRILPGERFRTSSVTVLFYKGSACDGQNAWRRFVRDVYSPIKEPLNELPFCAGLWGGMSTSACLERIDAVAQNKLPFNCFWMDAGWYGTGTQPSPDEYEGDWAQHTGDWTVNLVRHPDGLEDVSAAIRKAGKRFLLWFEPERVRKTAPIALHHPEYLIFPQEDKCQDTLLDLGNDEAWQYCFDTISGIVKDLGISVYRQDFNFQPLEYWRSADTDDRRGITEIKHINGLYRLWDRLIERFPHILIDNCASGGRRIDVETLRRSVPMWRSDAQCPAAIDPEITQAHALSYGSWMPFSGTGVGRTLFDTYRFRSAYSPTLTTNFTFSERDKFGDDERAIEWIRRMCDEYLRVKPYLYEDIYPLTLASTASDVWSAVQYHSPSDNSGVIQIFKRADAPYYEANFKLGGICDTDVYTFEDADDQNHFLECDGLRSNGLNVRIDGQRISKVYFYMVKK